MNDEVYTTTLADVEQTAQEFGRVVIDLTRAYDQIIVLDDSLIGPGCIKQFEATPYGYTRARRWAVRMDDQDEESDQPFEALRAEYLDFISSPPPA